MEFDTRIGGFAVIIWLVMVGAFLYLPKVIGITSYIEAIGWMQTALILIVLLPMSYFIVAFIDSR